MAPSIGDVVYDVELIARVDAAGDLGDELLTRLESRMVGAAVMENTRERTVDVMATLHAGSAESALQQARALVTEALGSMGHPGPDFVALHVTEVPVDQDLASTA